MNELNVRLVFARRFSECRKKQAMSQAEFAEFIGVSRATVGFYENAERTPDVEILRKICKSCNVSADWLIGQSDVSSIDLETKAVCERYGLNESSLAFLEKENSLWIAQKNRFSIINKLLSTELGQRFLWRAYDYCMCDYYFYPKMNRIDSITKIQCYIENINTHFIAISGGGKAWTINDILSPEELSLSLDEQVILVETFAKINNIKLSTDNEIFDDLYDTLILYDHANPSPFSLMSISADLIIAGLQTAAFDALKEFADKMKATRKTTGEMVEN